MDISLKLDTFEGPIELLYHLIEKNEIDIHDIPIAQLADQYIEIIKDFPPDMESLSSFLVMAATLLEIKSKLLLPPKKKDDEEALDPREELVRRLLEYKKFREISEILKSKGSELGTAVFKEMDKTVSGLFELPPGEVSEVLDGVSLNSLFDVFIDVLNRKELKVDKIRSSFGSVKRDEFTIEEKINHLKSILKFRKKISFREVFENFSDKGEVIVTFLALLELIKQKEVRIKQTDIFKDIEIEVSL